MGRWAAPKSEHSLRPGARVTFELTVFMVAAFALAAADATVAGVLLVLAAVFNTAVLAAVGD